MLPPYISINNHNLRVMHQSQYLACSRCQYLGHTASNTEACHAYCDDQDNIITIWSPKDVLCNYYSCEVSINGQTIRSSDHAFQWKLFSHVGRDNMAQEVLDAHTPEQAKEIALRIPSHLRGSWHKIKCDGRHPCGKQFIIRSSKNSYKEFGQTPCGSGQIRHFWNCGLNPRDAKTT